ncbi:MAG TPA: hypothetical protein VEA78_02645, partial [Acidimicrobiales bacterium]|nr:hypothetical protein [Acidimicrobiales bacterium]
RVPGLDLHRTWGMDADQVTDIGRSLAPDAPIVLMDMATGERHPFWSELDSHPETTDDERLLIIRPARNLLEGHRYLVVLRDVRGGDGATLRPTTPVASERVLADVERAGLAAPELYRAWDFTVASERNLTERVLSMRDRAFAELGDTNLADRVVAGRPPAFTIDEVVDLPVEQNRATARTVRGTVTVPNHLTHQVETTLAAPDALTEESLPVAVPGARLVYGDDGLPTVNALQPTVEVPFECHVPRTAGLADGLLYGHGLLGGRGEAGGSSTEDLRLRGFMPCAIDWLGMATADLANVASMLLDMSQFPSLPDRAQQGFVGFLLLGRAIAHPDGFASHPAFQDGDGQPRIRTGGVTYDGNSQGGIMGGALTALAPDFTRAKLGVPGMNYSTLLNRSVDWEGAYGAIAYAAYPSKIDQQLLFALIQMVWDRGEANGYAHHLTSDPLPNTPPHQVLLQVAYADHQVANVAAEVMARTAGARLHWPALGVDSPHWSVDPLFGLSPLDHAMPDGQSALVYWYAADRGNTMPPTGNVPPTSGEDPHGDPRKDNRASDQVAWFLRTGGFVDVCGGGPCVTTEATRSND